MASHRLMSTQRAPRSYYSFVPGTRKSHLPAPKGTHRRCCRASTIPEVASGGPSELRQLRSEPISPATQVVVRVATHPVRGGCVEALLAPLPCVRVRVGARVSPGTLPERLVPCARAANFRRGACRADDDDDSDDDARQQQHAGRAGRPAIARSGADRAGREKVRT
eukprot:scaffold1899_cov372-Prasinococcus_capsulatus_cf.AAC.4